MKEIHVLNQKLSTTRNKLLSEIIDDVEYFEIKKETQVRLEKLEDEISKSEDKVEIFNIKEMIDKAIHGITNISRLYTESGIKKKER